MKKLILTFILILVSSYMAFSQIPAPTNLTATFKNQPGITPMNTYGMVELKWQFVSVPTVLTTFKIYRKATGQTEFILFRSNIRALYYNDFDIKANKTYDYYVVAVQGTLTSPPSNTVSVTTPPLPDMVKFYTEPIRVGILNVPYIYNAKAKSSDTLAVLTYYLNTKPVGMTIDSVTGVINWTPTVAGNSPVSIMAKSNKGGMAVQSYSILVSGPKGAIRGIISDEITNLPLAKAKVYFYSSNACAGASVVTDSLGRFFAPMVAGKYKIRFMKEGYVQEFYNNKATFQLADTITLVGLDTISITASLAKIVPPTLYTISGSVKDAAGLPVKSELTAMLSSTANTPTGTNDCGMTVRTDSLGNYLFTLIGGKSYIIFARPYDKNYLPEYWDNKREYTLADKILLSENKTNINFVADPKPVFLNGISGKVKHFYGTQEGVFANVTAYKLVNNNRFIKSIISDSLGNYTLNNLEPGKYILRAFPKYPYIPAYYKATGIAFLWRDADTLILTETSLLNNIDINVKARTDTGFALAAGRVRTNLDQDLQGGVVYIMKNNEPVGYAISENNGSYIIDGLVNGTYNMVVDMIDYDNSAPTSITIDNNSLSYNVDLSVTPISPTSVGNENSTKPTDYSLLQNYPNPFNPSTLITFSIPEKTFVTLKIYNVLGKEVKVLVSDVKESGIYKVNFNAENLASGMYFYKLEAGKNIITKKMVLIK